MTTWWSAVLLLVLISPLWVGSSDQTSAGRTDHTIERFKQLYGNVRDYNEIKTLTLNGQHYILAFWNEDNDPLQLRVNIFRYSDEQLQMPVYKVFSGDVSE